MSAGSENLLNPITMDIVMEEGTLIPGESEGGISYYKELPDKPSINGEVLKDNYNEIDPTVPSIVKTIKSINEENLEISGNKLSVKTTNKVSADDVRPVTSQAVQIEIGNIEAVLALV